MHLSLNVLDAAIGLLDTAPDRERSRDDIVETTVCEAVEYVCWLLETIKPGRKVQVRETLWRRLTAVVGRGVGRCRLPGAARPSGGALLVARAP